MSKILIIEDEEPIRRVLVRILSDEDSGFEIQEASDGKKGIDLIKKESFDLVLCDIKMPKIDGSRVNDSYGFIMGDSHKPFLKLHSNIWSVKISPNLIELKSTSFIFVLLDLLISI